MVDGSGCNAFGCTHTHDERPRRPVGAGLPTGRALHPLAHYSERVTDWLWTELRGFIGLAIKPVARWGQGVWGGKGAAAQTAPYIQESCRWAPMPGIEGRAKP